MSINISKLKPTKKTKSALIVGSGASIDHLPYSTISAFFSRNAYVIAMNETWFLPALQYDFIINHHTLQGLDEKYLSTYQEHIEKNPFIHVHPFYDCCNPLRGKTKYTGEFYQYHGLPVCETTSIFIDPLVNPRKDYLFVGGSILFDAIGLAFHLGCKDLYFIGVDGGSVENHSYCAEYRKYWTEDNFYVYGHSLRTMAGLRAFMAWAKPRGWTFTNISQRMGNADPQPTEIDWDAHTGGWEFEIIEKCPV